MKKIVTVICLIATMQAAFAQNKIADSLNAELSKTRKPIERFRLIDKIAEGINATSGTVDSAACIQLLQIAQQLKNDSLLAISYNWIGAYFSLTKGDNTTALEYYFKAIPLAEKAKDKRRISSLYFDIAAVYFFIQNDEEYVKYIQKGGEHLPDRSHPLYDYMLAQYERGMASYFIADNQPDSALHYAQALAATSRRAKSLLFEYGGLHLAGAAYEKLGEIDLAEIYFKKAIALSDSVNGATARLRFTNNYTPYLLNNNRLAEAKEQANQLLSSGKLNNNSNLKLAGAGYLRQLFDTLHNKDSAYFYSRMEAEINAQIFSQNNNNKIQALAFNEQIRLLEESAKKAAEEEQRKENIQYALIALGIITFVILFFMLSRSIIVTEKWISFFGILGLLIVFEFINLLIHPFLERIIYHSPVLMLLALVAIASLLIPMHHRIEKWIREKMTEKNKKIRLAAAKRTIEQLEDNQTK